MSSCVLLCLRVGFNDKTGRSAEMTKWPSVAEALEAERELCRPRCGPWCEGVHSVVFADGCDLRTVGEIPPPPLLEDELVELYPSRFWDGYPPELWPLADELNEPFERVPLASPLPERLERGHAIAVTQLCATTATQYLGPLAAMAGFPGLPPVVRRAAGSSTGCEIVGCEGTHLARGLCMKHYAQWRRRLRPRKPTNREKFWGRVQKLDGDTGCWLWRGAKRGPEQYGCFYVDSERIPAHTFAYWMLVGPLPAGHRLAHDCPNHHCVRPDHLRLTTHQQSALLWRREKELQGVPV